MICKVNAESLEFAYSAWSRHTPRGMEKFLAKISRNVWFFAIDKYKDKML